MGQILVSPSLQDVLPIYNTQNAKTKQSKKFICGSNTAGAIGGGATILGTSSAPTLTAWAVGNKAGGAATRGALTFGALANDVLVELPIPDLFVHSGIAADCVLNLRLSTTNATDKFDYVIYKQDGTELVHATGTAIGFTTEANFSINIGALTWAKGDSLIVYLGNFQTSGGGVTTPVLRWIELVDIVGIEKDS